MARIATEHHGVVTATQLLEAGLTRSGVRRRVAKGRLHPLFRGVYRVGHAAPSVLATYMGAVLACGPGAVLSGAAAAFLWGLVKSAAPPAEVSVERDRSIEGVVVHRVRFLAGPDRDELHRIPITTVPRTLVDLAGRLSLDALARAAHEAEARHGVDATAVLASLGRRPNSPGAANLREIFEGQHRVTLSELERRFLGVLRSEELPLPLTNRPKGGRFVDCRWPERRLTVELDSYRYHHSRHAWEMDRRREREARARGDEFRRYTWDDVTVHTALTLRELRPLLLG